jgi:UDP-N-acetylmuramoylalanine--D-glutamate ligase
MEFSELSGKRVLIVGLAKTGVTLAKFLTRHGAAVTVSDHKSKAELSGFLDKLDGMNVTLELGGHTPKTFLNQDLIILSPGVPPHLKIFDYARSQGVHVTGELEFCAQFIKEPMIAITGTNGKTTTTHLIHTFLLESGVKSWIGGNFGEPLCEYLMQEQKADVLVVEVSSFQLEHVQKFNPKNIVFMNLAENHLDRYRTMEEYVNAKRKVFLNTNQGTTSILNADDNAVVELARDPMVQRGRIFYFSRKPSLEPQIMNIGGAVTIKNQIRVRTGPEIEYYSVEISKM